MTKITLPKSVKSIGAYAFSGCKSLETPTLPANLETIGSGAFSDCSSLTVPNGIETVGNWPFDDALQTITRSDGTQIPTADWVREVQKRRAQTNE